MSVRNAALGDAAWHEPRLQRILFVGVGAMSLALIGVAWFSVFAVLPEVWHQGGILLHAFDVTLCAAFPAGSAGIGLVVLIQFLLQHPRRARRIVFAFKLGMCAIVLPLARVALSWL